MRTSTERQGFPFIKAALVLFIVLVAVYIPLKFYVLRTEEAGERSYDPVNASIFITNELQGYREPCG
jgi:hypothetical protein